MLSFHVLLLQRPIKTLRRRPGSEFNCAGCHLFMKISDTFTFECLMPPHALLRPRPPWCPTLTQTILKNPLSPQTRTPTSMELSLSTITDFNPASIHPTPQLSIVPYDGVIQEAKTGEQRIFPRFLLLDSGGRMTLDGGTVYFCKGAVDAFIFLAENHGPIPRLSSELAVVKCRFHGRPNNPPLLLLIPHGRVVLPRIHKPNPGFVGTRRNTILFGRRSFLSAPRASYEGGTVNGQEFPGWGDTSLEWEMTRLTVQLEVLTNELGRTEYVVKIFPPPFKDLSLTLVQTRPNPSRNADQQ